MVDLLYVLVALCLSSDKWEKFLNKSTNNLNIFHLSEF